MVLEIQIETSGDQYKTKSFSFSGGELQVQIPGMPERVSGDIRVIARLQSSDDIVRLVLVSEILDRAHRKGDRVLVVPYFPFARQDRVMQPAEAFSLKAVARLMNSLSFDEVIVCDPHSDVTAALVNNVRVIPQLELVAAHSKLSELLQEKPAVIIAPDAGATKKAFSISQRFGQPLVTAAKIRDKSTGAIIRTEVPTSPWIAGHDAIIVDDICDGGRTFVELTKVLKSEGVRQVFLYVTHGIFSQGLGVFKGLIDAVYTTDAFLSPDVETPHQAPIPLHVSPVHF